MSVIGLAIFRLNGKVEVWRWPFINTCRALTSMKRRGGFNQPDIKQAKCFVVHDELHDKITVFVMTTNHDKSFPFLIKMFVAYKSEI